MIARILLPNIAGFPNVTAVSSQHTSVHCFKGLYAVLYIFITCKEAKCV